MLKKLKKAYKKIKKFFTQGNSSSTQQAQKSGYSTSKADVTAVRNAFKTGQKKTAKTEEEIQRAKWGDAFNPKTKKVSSNFSKHNPYTDWKDFNKSGGYNTYDGTLKKNQKYSKFASNITDSAEFESKRHPYAYSMSRGLASSTSYGASDLLETLASKETKKNLKNAEKWQTKGSKRAGTAAEIAGSIASFGIASGGTNKAAVKLMSKSAKVDKAIESLSKSKMMRSYAEKMIARGATKESAEAIAKKQAEKVIYGLGKDFALNATVGNVQAGTEAYVEGKNWKDRVKKYGINTAENLAIGAGIEVAPTVVKATKKVGKRTLKKAAEQLAEMEAKQAAKKTAKLTAKKQTKKLVKATLEDAKAVDGSVDNAVKSELKSDVKPLAKGTKLADESNIKSVVEAVDNQAPLESTAKNVADEVEQTPLDKLAKKKEVKPNIESKSDRTFKQVADEINKANGIEGGTQMTFNPKETDGRLSNAAEYINAGGELPKNDPTTVLRAKNFEMKRVENNKALRKKGLMQSKTSTTAFKNAPTEEIRQAVKDEVNSGDYTRNIFGVNKKAEEAYNKVLERPQEVYDAINAINSGDVEVTAKSLPQLLMDTGALRVYASKTKNIEVYDACNELIAEYGSLCGLGLRVQRAYSELPSVKKFNVLDKAAKRYVDHAGANFDEIIEKIGGRKEYERMINDAISSDDEKVANAAKKELFAKIGGATPKTLHSALAEWRYFSMLANPTTHIRNILGNVSHTAIRMCNDVMASGMQASLMKQGKLEYGTKTKSAIKDSIAAQFKNNKYAEVLDKYAKDDVDSLINATEKYESFEKGQSDKGILKKTVGRLSNLNTNALNLEDKSAVTFNYRRTMYQFLKANGYGTDAAKFPPDEMIERAREIASRDSLEATFRDYNAAAEWVNTQKRNLSRGDASAAQKALNIGLDSIIPFVNTPLNVTKQSIRLSPVGLLQGQKMLKTALKEGSPEAVNEAVERIAGGISGSAILGLGVFLGSRDIELSPFAATTTMKGNSKEKYLKSLGFQEYSVKIGGHTYTMDWLTPISSTFFTGVEIGKQARQREGSEAVGWLDDMGSISITAARILDPLLNTSMMSGFENILSNENSEKSVVSNIIDKSVQGYSQQFIPTFLGKVSNVVAPYDYDLTADAQTKSGQELGYYKNQMISKIPGLSKAVLPEKVDIWGNTSGKKKDAKDYALSAVQNFVSPSYVKEIKETQTDKNLLKLYDKMLAEGEDPDEAAKVLPKTDYNFTKTIGKNARNYGIMSEKIQMTPKQRAKYLKARGTGGRDVMEKAGLSREFNKAADGLSNEERQAMIDNAPKSTKKAIAKLMQSKQYQNASTYEKHSIIKKALADANTDSGKHIIYDEVHKKDKDFSKSDYAFKTKLSPRVQAEYSKYKNILTKKQFVDFYKYAAKDSYAKSQGAEGQRYHNFSKKSMLAYLNSDAGAELTEEQAAALYNSFKNSNYKPYSGRSGYSGKSKGYGKRRRYYSSSGSSGQSKKKSVNKADWKAKSQSYNKQGLSSKSFAGKSSGVKLASSTATLKAVAPKTTKSTKKVNPKKELPH